MSSCGTGSGNFPQPGDPSTDTVLSAQAVLGGILLRWSYPGLNPQAVAHFNLYRSMSDDPDTRVRIATATGSTYMDWLGDETVNHTYYYWIEVVSVNGTVGELRGPASAQLRLIHTMIIESIMGRLPDGSLDGTVRTQLGKIDALADDLVDEIANREYGDSAINDALGQQLSQLEDVDTLLTTEVSERKSADSAILTEVDLILAKANENEAAIVEERQVRADEDSALATQITTLQANVDDNSAAIVNESTARANADSALASQVSTLQSQVNSNGAAIQQESTTRADETSALASDITTLETTVGENSASIQTHAETINGLEASYVVKSNVNGYVTGFGLYNDGGQGAFRVHADYFSVGNPTHGGDLPFVVDTVNGQSKITLNAKTFIPDASIGTAAIENAAINSAKIGNAAVDTLKLAGEAVTVPRSATGSGGSASSSWTTVLTLTVNFGSNAPNAVMVTGGANFLSSGADATSCRIRVRQGASSGGEMGTSVGDGQSTCIATAHRFSAYSSSYTYYLQVQADAPFNIGNKFLTVLGVKR